jgi:hypothetical protein
VLREGTAPGPRRLLSETSRFDTNRIGLLSGALRLEWELDSGRAELFDVVADPQELHDLAAHLPRSVSALEREAVAAMGRPWEARTAGTVRTSGAILHDGRASPTLVVAAGMRFQVLPVDADVWHGEQGPWRAVGGTPPGPHDPLAVSVEGNRPGTVRLDAAAKQRLEALGYVQEDE